ncbi:hypothetical protein [Flavobacterium sp.]|uniref:hypothetical protein n=1 Tax=Flavobacterium sp. TaxID=239 RepID=UPI002B4B64D7|nr:hypothetical protein [Flavobacterium sp.]HLP63249.1 hypothetical protein [Flavobacterium sp.]
MKKIFFTLLLLCGFLGQAQIVFKNRDPKGSLPKFIIKNGETEIYNKLGGKENLIQAFKQVPQIYDNLDGRSRARMTVSITDNVARRTFVVTYTLYRQTQKYAAGIEYTIDFHDKRPNKVFNEYFDSI